MTNPNKLDHTFIMEKQHLKDNLHQALGLFIEGIRFYIVSLLEKEAGNKWPDLYYDALSDKQKEGWDLNIKNGTEPINLIDYHNLGTFAIKYKRLLRKDFGRDANNLSAWFNLLSEVRNAENHYNHNIDEIKIEQAYNHMIVIARSLEMKDLEEELLALKEGKPLKTKSPSPEGAASTGLIPWFRNVRPHLDIRQGNLDESVFAANLAEVALGTGREVYRNYTTFFTKTYLTLGLKTVAKRVIKGLNGEEDAENRVISLQTGFGGGKTHTLISLYHIARLGSQLAKSEFAQPLLEFTGQPKFDSANIAVFTNTTNDPTQGRITDDGIHIQTLWGELAHQLGGAEAYQIIKANDENRTAPKGLFKKVLEKTKPALILIDELADYCVAASGITVGVSTLSDQTISFMQELTEAVAGTNNCVMVATLPASDSEVASSPNAAQILSSLSGRLTRVGADTKPVADEEIFEVISARLFENLDDERIKRIKENCIDAYFNMYQEFGSELPSQAAKLEYKEKLRKAYPFHPELVDMFRIRWASNHDFQRTRGVLRLLASIVSDLWKRRNSLIGTNALIHTSDVDFNNLDALSGQLKKLYGNGYDAVISADVSGPSSNALKIDDDHPEYGEYNLAQGIASTILLGSFGSTSANKGMTIQEIKLCVLKPKAFNHNNINGAIDMLEAKAHYLYYSTTGTPSKRYWFHTKPNINILINQAKQEIKNDEISAQIIHRIENKKTNILKFNILVNPSGDIPEQRKPTLIILGPDHFANPDTINGRTKPLIEKIASRKGNSERIYRNTFLFLLCSEFGVGRLHNDVREYLACKKIYNEYKNQIEKDQLEEIKRKIDDSNKQVERNLVAAYSIVAKYSATRGIDKLILKNFKDTLDIQINTTLYEQLKDEEWLLESIGQGTLRSNNLFPTPDKPVRVKDIYEAFIRFDDKPMIANENSVQNSLQRYCLAGEFIIAQGEPTHFGKMFFREQVPFFDVNDDTYWLVDKSHHTPPETNESHTPNSTETTYGEPNEYTQKPEVPRQKEPLNEKTIRSITISGKVDVANYPQLFNSFIMPLKDNKVEIEIKITGKSTQSAPITRNSNQYKITKESATQLGLDFQEED